MGLRLRQLKLRVQTDAGLFGCNLEFSNGLNVLWADNTKGKSTAVQSIIYALGLERMLSSQREIPLPYAMTDYLREGEDLSEQQHAVHSSTVWLEIENEAHEVIGLRRRVKAEQSTKLISVFPGGIPEEGSVVEGRDYFVRDPGSATREAGFHKFLSGFLGWDLPTVTKYDGAETLLYLETLFPLFYVEQKFGWSAFPAAFPTYLGIRDMGRKSVEFVLDLDTHDIELEQERLNQSLQATRAGWESLRTGLIQDLRSKGAEIAHLPSSPDMPVDELVLPSLFVQSGDKRIPLSETIKELRGKIDASRRDAAPAVSTIAPQLENEIATLTDELNSLNSDRVETHHRRNLEHTEVQALSQRLRSIDADLRKNKDVQKLRSLGSDHIPSGRIDHCPTCDQPIEDGLLPQQVLGPLMSVEQNIAFLAAQRSIYESLLAQGQRAMEASSQQLTAASERVSATSSRIRAIKADLIGPASALSESVIEERLGWERKAQIFDDLQLQVQERLDQIHEVSSQYLELLATKKALPKDRLSEADMEKVQQFVRRVQEQLAQYGFSTFEPEQLSLTENFRLEKEGFEIGFQTSASDSIRLKWAYQLGLLEVARTCDTNHVGMVIFDEPRQQEAARLSFIQLLNRAQNSRQFSQQVIFATSEDLAELRSDLSDIDCKLQVVEGWMLQKLENTLGSRPQSPSE